MIYDLRHNQDLNFTFLGMTLSSHYKVSSKINFYYLSFQYKVKIKNNDLLVSVQGQSKNQSLQSSRLSTRSKWRTMTLSSQYKVSSIQNLWPSRLSTRSIQGTRHFVLVQGLDLYLYIYFNVFYFQNRTKLVFLSLLIFYSDNLNFISSDHLVKFK